MSLKDDLIMGVPSDVLKFIAKKNELTPGGTTIVDYATALSSSQKTINIAGEIAKGYKYAGRTAANLFEILGIDSAWQKQDYFKKHLHKKYRENIFTTGIRPELSEHPQLIQVIDQKQNLILVFSYLSKPKPIIYNFEVIYNQQQHNDYVIVHFNPLLFEFRCSASDNYKYKEAILGVLEINTSNKGVNIAWDQITNLTDAEVMELAIILGARLRVIKAKMTDGAFATKEVTAAPSVPDLSKEPEYQEEFSGKPFRKLVYTFDYSYNYGYQQPISYQVTKSGLNFVTSVPEEVVSFVLDKIIDIRKGTIQKLQKQSN